MDLRGADLSGADLAGVKWDPALFDCRTRFPEGFSVAELPLLPVWTGCAGRPPQTGALPEYGFQRGPRLIKLDLRKASFAGMSLAGFGFWQSQLDGADFSRARLAGADFQGGSYTGISFKDADLSKANFSSAVFAGASFENANLSGARIRADFSKARMAGAVLTGACYDKTTLWPERFDPAAAGAKPC
jgi:uncharacterized protein YjbI with pentapeptide repeats